jgi:hypothetical protein
MIKVAHQYLLVQLTKSMNWNLTSVLTDPTDISTWTVLTTSSFSLEKCHRDVASYALLDANKNSENITMKCEPGEIL